jgi:acetyl-CoA C-acetyltransferase
LWADVCHAATADTGVAAGDVLSAVDSLAVLYCQSWPYDDPPGRLAARLGTQPRDLFYSGIGGTTPHVLVNRAAEAIAAGHADVALVVGGEALETVRQAKKAGQRLAWSHRDPEKKPFPYEAPFHPAEVAHGVFQAWLTFAVFDVSRRAHLAIQPDEYRRRLGDLLAPMTMVAAHNPYAWFQTPRSPGELIEPTPTNRVVGYPYTKTMVSIMDVDMAAALVVTSHAAADSIGVPPDRRVYLRGSGDAADPVYLAQHPRLWESPAMTSASAAALHAAGIGIDDVAHLDLYSCFASSVNLACDALGIVPDDARGVTVTGGLPFAGGPGSGYVLHSTATMVDSLRRDPGSFGLVSGVGMHMTKHAFAIYSTTPPVGAVAAPSRRPHAGAGSPAANEKPVPVVERYTGPATVATYSVVHGRDGSREWALAICDTPDGSRCYARTDDLELMARAEKEEWVGAPVVLVTGDDAVNRIEAQ